MVVTKEFILQDDNIIRSTETFPIVDTKGLGYEMFHSMLKHKDNVAQIDGDTDEKDYYDSLLLRSIRTAMEMARRGIGSNDIISICSSHHLNTCIPFIAATFLGAKIAPLDSKLLLSDTAYLLKLTKPKMVFVEASSINLIKEAAEQESVVTEIVVFGPTVTETPFSEFLSPKENEENFKPVEVECSKETALIFFSSGTTGFPKGICLSHFCLVNSIQPFMRYIAVDVSLLCTPLYWITAGLTLIVTIMKGNTRILFKEADPVKIWKNIDKHKITFMLFGPYVLFSLYNAEKPKELDTSSLKHLFCGGAAVPRNLLIEMRKLLPETFVCPVYGQTETSGFITYFNHEDPEDRKLSSLKPDSCGRPIGNALIKVVDLKTGKPLGFNKWGELRVKGVCMMNGYYNIDSSSAFDEEGWLKTGDVVYYDEDFCFYIVDRIKEMLKFRSWHVVPAVLENIVCTHPAVEAAIVVGVPHETDGDHPAACVILKKEHENCEPEDIQKFVDERVDDNKKLRGGVIFVKAFPRTPTDKIDRKKIRESVMKRIAV